MEAPATSMNVSRRNSGVGFDFGRFPMPSTMGVFLCIFSFVPPNLGFPHMFLTSIRQWSLVSPNRSNFYLLISTQRKCTRNLEMRLSL